MTGNHLVGGVNAAFIGVTDPGPALDLYVGQLGWQVADEGVISAPAAARLWGEGVGELAVTVLTAAGAGHGRLVLLRVPDQPLPAHPRQADTGLIAINMYTRDIEVTYRQLVEAGQQWATKPATWEVPLGERMVTVTQGFLLAPQATDIVFVQPAQPRGTAAWDVDPERHYTELTSVVCHVPDFEAETRFWGADGLGLASWYDVTFSHPGLEALANLPPGTVMRLSFLAGPTTARIEVTRIADRTLGTDRRATQRTARHLGHTGWLVEVRDLEATVARAVELGATVHAAPHAGPEFLFAGRPVAFLDTPNGLPVTFVEHGG
ncbi:MAG: VOC family protein [Micromonosporaceae bacterium]|nr:VOC family protein [Micromonosporaceae bacterium]